MGPFPHGADLLVDQSFVGGGNAEQEIRRIDRLGVGGLGHGDLERLQARRLGGRVVNIDVVESLGKEVLVDLGHGFAGDLLTMEAHMSACIVDVVLEPVLLLQRLQVGCVQGALS